MNYTISILQPIHSMKLLLITADPKTLLCHRKELIRSIAGKGWEVVAAASGPGGAAEEFLKSIGGRYVELNGARSGMNPLQDWRAFRELRKVIREEAPDAVLPYTIKSVAYGSLAASLEHVPAIYPLICGLGYAFAPASSLKQWLVGRVSSLLYKVALRRATLVFLQNHEDERLLRARGILHRETPSQVVNGSGVELDAFTPREMDTVGVERGRMNFVMVSRLLKSKGIREYVEASRALRAEFPLWQFHVLGAVDPGPDGISAQEVERWVADGLIHYHGSQSDVRPFLAQAHAFVLPTYYREGVPRASLEALAAGLPIITTDSVGARETVQLTTAGELQRRAQEPVMEGKNGYLVRPRHVPGLCYAMRLLAGRAHRLPELSTQSRQLALSRFDVHRVNAVMMQQIFSTLPTPIPSFQPALPV